MGRSSSKTRSCEPQAILTTHLARYLPDLLYEQINSSCRSTGIMEKYGEV